MCVHRLFIYTTCGHSVFSPTPLIICEKASIPPTTKYSTSCELIAHPFQSWRIDDQCGTCIAVRRELLSRIDAEQAIKIEETKWRTSFGGIPKPGPVGDGVAGTGALTTALGLGDVWGRRAKEREKERLEAERERRRMRRLSKRFSWKKGPADEEDGVLGVDAVVGRTARLDVGWLKEEDESTLVERSSNASGTTAVSEAQTATTSTSNATAAAALRRKTYIHQH